MCSKRRPARGHLLQAGAVTGALSGRTRDLLRGRGCVAPFDCRQSESAATIGCARAAGRTALEFAESIVAKRRKLGAYAGGSDALEIEGLIDAVRATTGDLHAEATRLLSQRTPKNSVGTTSGEDHCHCGCFSQGRVVDTSLPRHHPRDWLQFSCTVTTQHPERRIGTASERAHGVSAVGCHYQQDPGRKHHGLESERRKGVRLFVGGGPEQADGPAFPPGSGEEESGILARISCGESVHHFETVRVRKDGKKIDVSVTISPISGPTGAPLVAVP